MVVLCPISAFAQNSATGKIGSHEYVDLGLSVLWATCNVGANSPEGYGGYYAWGETTTKSSYTGNNCETWNKRISDIMGTSRDVARAQWGDPWRMPTDAEFNELLQADNCEWTWTTLNGINGYKVTSKKAGYKGNYIFLPAAGWRTGDWPFSQNQFGCYWSSTPKESSSLEAYCLDFGKSRGHLYHEMYDSNRDSGKSIHPVASKDSAKKTSIKTCVFGGEMYAVFDKNTNDWNYTKASTSCVVGDMTGSWSAFGFYTDSRGEQQTLFMLDEISDMATSDDYLEVSFKGSVPVLNEKVYGSIHYKYSSKTLIYSDSRGNKIMMLGVKLLTAF